MRIVKKKGFQVVDTLKVHDSFSGDRNYYEIFRAVLEEDNFELVAKVETKDKYRSFGNGDEPWSSTLEMWDNGKKVRENHTLFGNDI